MAVVWFGVMWCGTLEVLREESLVVQGVTGGGLATRQSRGAMGGG